MEALRIGFAEADITPKGRIALIGQFGERLTDEVKAPLCAVAMVITADGKLVPITLYVKGLTNEEKTIILEGCLINYYAAAAK